MIKKHVVDGQTLAVGKQDYASVISSCFVSAKAPLFASHLWNNFEHQLFCGLFQGIKCMCNSSVEELMWGLEIQIPHVVRQENSELTYKDCFRMSKGMEYLLNRHNFDVKPEMMVSPSPPSTYVWHWTAFCLIAHCILQAFSFHTDQRILQQYSFWNFAFRCSLCISNVP